jgi:Leucine-rich repeat (LRR) protein
VVGFIPTEITREFPKLNAVAFWKSNVPIVRKGLFGSDFKNVQFLAFYDSKLVSIEPDAFEELTNLKFISISDNPLKTLPFGLFRNNLKLEIARFHNNKISMIHPALFNGLHRLKFAIFLGNVCVNRNFGCDTCTVSQSELNSGLATCFANCRADPICSNSERTTIPKIEIPSSSESTDIKPVNLESCEAILKNQSIEIEKICLKTAQLEEKLHENEQSVETLKDTILKATNDRFDKVVELVETKLELEKAKHDLEKKDLKEKIEKLEEKLATQCQDMEEKFKQQMADYVKKQLEEFENRLIA